MIGYQYDLFKDNTELTFIKDEIEDVKRKNDSLRKGMFFRHHELEKTVFELKDEINKLKGILVDSKKCDKTEKEMV
jgi:hypothetical protein